MYNLTMRRTSITGKQKLLIGFLALVLLVVVWKNVGSLTPVATNGLPQPLINYRDMASLPSEYAFQNVNQQMDALQKMDLTGPHVQSTVNILELLAYNPFLGPRQGENSRQNAMQVLERTQVLQSTAPLESSEQDNRLDGSPPQRDILLPATHARVGKVSAIITGGDRPAVLINEQIYFEDDNVGESFRIHAIEPDRIIVEAILPE